MTLRFSITSTTRDVDGPDGYVYRTITTLDFHQGWFTRLMRTTRADNGYPMWSHGIRTESLTELGDWSPNCAARPIMKFPTFEAAADWLAAFFAGVSPETEEEARKAYTDYCDNADIHSNRFPSWQELSENSKNEWRKKVQ
jgi:hypothetical protein